jgi:hypothetical protein
MRFLCLHPSPARQLQFRVVLSVECHFASCRFQGHRNQLGEFSVSENRGVGEFANRNLFQNLTRRGERFDENRLFIANICRHRMEIL